MTTITRSYSSGQPIIPKTGPQSTDISETVKQRLQLGADVEVDQTGLFDKYTRNLVIPSGRTFVAMPPEGAENVLTGTGSAYLYERNSWERYSHTYPYRQYNGWIYTPSSINWDLKYREFYPYRLGTGENNVPGSFFVNHPGLYDENADVFDSAIIKKQLNNYLTYIENGHVFDPKKSYVLYGTSFSYSPTLTPDNVDYTDDFIEQLALQGLDFIPFRTIPEEADVISYANNQGIIYVDAFVELYNQINGTSFPDIEALNIEAKYDFYKKVDELGLCLLVFCPETDNDRGLKMLEHIVNTNNADGYSFTFGELDGGKKVALATLASESTTLNAYPDMGQVYLSFAMDPASYTGFEILYTDNPGENADWHKLNYVYVDSPDGEEKMIDNTLGDNGFRVYKVEFTIPGQQSEDIQKAISYSVINLDNVTGDALKETFLTDLNLFIETENLTNLSDTTAIDFEKIYTLYNAGNSIKYSYIISLLETTGNIIIDDAVKTNIYNNIDDLFDALLNVYPVTIDNINFLVSLVSNGLDSDQKATLNMYSQVESGRYYVSGLSVPKAFYETLLNGYYSPNQIRTDLTQYVDTKYTELLNSYKYFTGGDTIYMRDPSQSNRITSDSQAMWLNNVVQMAQIDDQSAATYQSDFDAMLKGLYQMVVLYMYSDPDGMLPVSAAKIGTYGGLELDHSVTNPQNSSSGADMNMVRGLIRAQEMVDAGTWVDHVYGLRAIDLIAHVQSTLFKSENGVLILKTSEDADGGYVNTDHMCPATCIEISEFLSKNGGSEEDITFWLKAAADMLKAYKAIYNDCGEFVAKAVLSVDVDGNITASRYDNTVQSYNGIASPMKLGEYVLEYCENPEDFNFVKSYVQSGLNYQWTQDEVMDKSLYLPSVMALGDGASAYNIIQDVTASSNQLSTDKYFSNTLMLGSMLSALESYSVDYEPGNYLTASERNIYNGLTSVNNINTLAGYGIDMPSYDPKYNYEISQLITLFGSSTPIGNNVDGNVWIGYLDQGYSAREAYVLAFLDANSDGYYYKGQPLSTGTNLTDLYSDMNLDQIFDNIMYVADNSTTVALRLQEKGVEGFYAQELSSDYIYLAQKMSDLVTGSQDLSGLDVYDLYYYAQSKIASNPTGDRTAMLDEVFGNYILTAEWSQSLSDFNISGYSEFIKNNTNFDYTNIEFAKYLVDNMTNSYSSSQNFSDLLVYKTNPQSIFDTVNDPLYVEAVYYGLSNIEGAETSQLSAVLYELKLARPFPPYETKIDFLEVIKFWQQEGEIIPIALAFAYFTTNNIHINNPDGANADEIIEDAAWFRSQIYAGRLGILITSLDGVQVIESNLALELDLQAIGIRPETYIENATDQQYQDFCRYVLDFVQTHPGTTLISDDINYLYANPSVSPFNTSLYDETVEYGLINTVGASNDDLSAVMYELKLVRTTPPYETKIDFQDVMKFHNQGEIIPVAIAFAYLTTNDISIKDKNGETAYDIIEYAQLYKDEVMNGNLADILNGDVAYELGQGYDTSSAFNSLGITTYDPSNTDDGYQEFCKNLLEFLQNNPDAVLALDSQGNLRSLDVYYSVYVNGDRSISSILAGSENGAAGVSSTLGFSSVNAITHGKYDLTINHQENIPNGRQVYQYKFREYDSEELVTAPYQFRTEHINSNGYMFCPDGATVRYFLNPNFPSRLSNDMGWGQAYDYNPSNYATLIIQTNASASQVKKIKKVEDELIIYIEEAQGDESMSNYLLVNMNYSDIAEPLSKGNITIHNVTVDGVSSVPVNQGTRINGMGAVTMSRTDLPTPANALLKLPFTRTYNHRETSDKYMPSHKGVHPLYSMISITGTKVAEFGEGWTSGFNMVASVRRVNGAKYTVIDLAGKRFMFEGNVLRYPENETAKIADEITILPYDSDSFVFEYNGLKYKFIRDHYDNDGTPTNVISNSAYVIENITAQNGGKIAFTYESQSPAVEEHYIEIANPNYNYRITMSRLKKIEYINNNLDDNTSETVSEIVLDYEMDKDSIINTNTAMFEEYFAISKATAFVDGSPVNEVTYDIDGDGYLHSVTGFDGKTESYGFSDLTGGGALAINNVTNDNGQVSYTYYKDPKLSGAANETGTYMVKTMTETKDGNNYTTTYDYDSEIRQSTIPVLSENDLYIDQQSITTHTGEQTIISTNKGKPVLKEHSDGSIETWEYDGENLIRHKITSRAHKAETTYSGHNEFHQPSQIIQTVSNGSETKITTTNLTYDRKFVDNGYMPVVNSKSVTVDGVLVSNETMTYDESDKGKPSKLVTSVLNGVAVNQLNNQIATDVEYNADGEVESKIVHNWDVDGAEKDIEDTTVKTETTITVDDNEHDVYKYESLSGKYIYTDYDDNLQPFEAVGYELSSEIYIEKYTGNKLREIDVNDNVTDYTYDKLKRPLKTFWNGLLISESTYADEYIDRVLENGTTLSGVRMETIYQNTDETDTTDAVRDIVVKKYYNQKGQLVYLDNIKVALGVDNNRNGTIDDDFFYPADESYTYNDYGQVVNKEIKGDDTVNISYEYDSKYHDKLIKTTENYPDVSPVITKYAKDYINGVERTERGFKISEVKKNLSGETEAISYPGNLTVNLDYHSNGSVEKLTDPRNIDLTYNSSSVGNVEKSNEFSLETNAKYDAFGQVLEKSYGTSQTPMVISSYDKMSRKREDVFAGDFHYLYYYLPENITHDPGYTDYINGAGKLAGVYGYIGQIGSWIDSEWHENQFRYDKYGNIRKEYIGVGPRTRFSNSGNNEHFKELQYAFSLMGNIESETLSDGSVLNYVNDKLGRLYKVKITKPNGQEETLKTYYYDNKGNIDLVKYGTGIEISYEYDGKNRMSAQEINNTNGLVERKSYTYDSNDRLWKIDVTDSQGVAIRKEAYGYDINDQLISTTINDHGVFTAYEYEYDKAGNRVSSKQTGQDDRTIVLDPVSNRITEILQDSGNITFNYDSRGNIQKKTDSSTGKDTIYNYNDLDQMTGVTVRSHDGQTTYFSAEYVYDYKGMMRKSVEDGVTKFYVYDQYDQLVHITDENETILKTYIYANGARIGEVDADSNTTYYLNDYQGSMIGTMNADGTISNRQDFSPYGKPQDMSQNDISYTGKYYNKQTGLYYFHARWYDPDLGIFLTKDPASYDLSNPTTINPYQFTGNNPINNVDPDGRFFFALVVAGLISAATSALMAKMQNVEFTWEDAWRSFVAGALTHGMDKAFQGFDLGSGLLNDFAEHGLRAGIEDLSYAALTNQLNDDNMFNIFGSGFAVGGASGIASDIYQKQVGERPDAKPGIGPDEHKYGDGRAIGNSGNEWFKTCDIGFGKGDPALKSGALSFWLREGKGVASFTLNLVPGFNATARMHDTFGAISGFGTVTNFAEDAVVTYSALYRQFYNTRRDYVYK